MASGSMGRRVGALAALVVVTAPSVASAHAYVMQPPSRDVGEPSLDARAKKFGPCGGSPRTNNPTQYDVGETIEVKIQETIDHRGCFQIAFSPANDTDWVTLDQFDDPAGTPKNEIFTRMVKLPDGVSCKDCTLVVRQLMINTDCEPDASPNATGPGDTYFSCADIRVGDFPDVSTVPTDGGGKTVDAGQEREPRRISNVDSSEGGCSMALGATSGLSFVTSIGVGLLALARLRRRRQ